MIYHKIALLPLSLAMMLLAQPLAASESESTDPPEAEATSQKPQGDPRMVVPENLLEMPHVRMVDPIDGMQEEFQEILQDDPEGVDDDSLPQEILDKGDTLMDITRLPLTYVQDHVPFFTKRQMIFFGRLELEYDHYSSGVLKDESGFLIRRFRVGLAGQVRFWDGWNYKVEIDLTDSENNLSDAYISWLTPHWGTIRIGNQKVAQTMSGQTSSLSIPFMERPLPVLAFTLNRRLGLGYDLHRNKWGINATVFGVDPNEDAGSDGYAARFYFNPTREQTHVLHIGASWMQLSSDSDARLFARPESNRTDIFLVDTGVWPDVDTGSSLSFELAGSRGPVTLRSEFYRSKWNRSDASDPEFSGWYVEGSWFLTGEMNHYREGKFIRPRISGGGAWELAVRFSTLDLNDDDIEGGTQKNISFGVNWYSPEHWRFMANLIKVDADGPQGEQDPWIIQGRAQYFF
jgi:phosphate-selective porin OprO/OprP